MAERIALYVGIDVRDLYDLGRRLAVPLAIEGDGWEAWGEAVGTAGNGGCTLNVVMAITPERADELLPGVAGCLVRSEGTTRVAVETPRDDWDVAEHGGRIWHRIVCLDGTFMLVTERVLPTQS